MTDATFTSLPESHYRDLLAKQLGGQIEVKLTFGRADVMTDTHVFEVEPVKTWRVGARQALQYAAQVPRRGALALYGDNADLLAMFWELKRLPGSGLELWWLAGEEFTLLENLSDVAKFVPLRFGGAAQPQSMREDGPGGGAIGELAHLCQALTGLVIGLASEHGEMRDRVSELEQQIASLRCGGVDLQPEAVLAGR